MSMCEDIQYPVLKFVNVISYKPLAFVGILPNLQLRCSCGQVTWFDSKVKDQLCSKRHFGRHILQAACGNFITFTIFDEVIRF